MNNIIPFATGAASMWLLQRISMTWKMCFANSYIKDGKYMLFNSFRNYNNIALVNKEPLVNKGYEIDVNNTTGWFWSHITEITISKKDPATKTRMEEYETLKNAIRESRFHVTYDEDDKVIIDNLVDSPEELEKTD